MKTDTDDFIRKRFNDLDQRASARAYPVYTDFCDARELSILHTMHFFSTVTTDGGYELSERQMVCFMPSDAFFEQNVDFPFKAIRISCRNQNFAESLTHRDYLGALMSLGIRRELLGDLLVDSKDHSCTLFCVDRIAPLILDNIISVRHTEVFASLIDFHGSDIRPSFRQETIIISSDRLDSLVAAAAHTSRTKGCLLIDSERVMINSRIEKSHTRQISSGDIITIRGNGKFRISDFTGLTNKGRIKVSIEWYD